MLLGLGAQDSSPAASEPEQTDGHTKQREGPLAEALAALQAQQDLTGRISVLKCEGYETIPLFLLQLSLVLEILTAVPRPRDSDSCPSS